MSIEEPAKTLIGVPLILEERAGRSVLRSQEYYTHPPLLSVTEEDGDRVTRKLGDRESHAVYRSKR